MLFVCSIKIHNQGTRVQHCYNEAAPLSFFTSFSMSSFSLKLRGMLHFKPISSSTKATYRSGIKLPPITAMVKQIKPRYIQDQEAKTVTAGCIVWLPRKEHILPGAHVDKRLRHGAFDHPAVIVSISKPLRLTSQVEIALVRPHQSLCDCSTFHLLTASIDDFRRWTYHSRNQPARAAEEHAACQDQCFSKCES